MRHSLTLILSTAAACALLAGPALAATGDTGNGGDLNARQEQAQLHPWQANLAPLYVPGGVPEGEVYDSAGPYSYYSPNGVRPDSPYVVPYAQAPYYVAPNGGPVTAPLAAVGQTAGALVAAPFNAAAGIVGGLTGATYAASPAYGAPETMGAPPYAPGAPYATAYIAPTRTGCEVYRDFNGRYTSLCP